MGVSLLQPSFASGELSPSLYARVDLNRYQTGLRTCKNMWIMAYGGARNRPGTVFLESTKGNKVARLIRFKFSSLDAYVMEFTDRCMRLYRDGAIVLNSSGPSAGQPFELVIPFTEPQLFELTFTQSADVMTIAHPDHKPQQLKRFGHDNWTIGPMSFLPSVATPTSATATSATGTGNSQTWKYQVTAVVDDGSVIDESLPVTSNAVTVYSATLSASLTWPAVAGATYYNVYKDNSGSGVFGFAGRSTSASFTDNNITATASDSPPTGNDPFTGPGKYPGAVVFYQQRLVFGGTDLMPQTSWFSKVGLFNNFGYATPLKDDDAITFTQASLEVNRIMHYLPLRQLLVHTSGSEWVMSGGANGLTAKTAQANIQSYNGIGMVPPLVIDNTVLYVQARGTQVSSLAYSLQDDGYAGSDLTILSSHLFRDFSISDWAFQKIPDTTVWCVRSDGKLLGLTFLREQEVTAWHWHETDGAFESVCTVPEVREDATYVVVRREINGVTRRYVERFATRQIQKDISGNLTAEKCYFVDCGLSYDGWNRGPATRRLQSSGSWQYPNQIECVASDAPFTAGSTGNGIVFLYRNANGSITKLRTRIATYIDAKTVLVEPLGTVPLELRNVATPYWGYAVDDLSGLAHLEGKEVAILSDGNVAPRRVVTGGKVSLADPGVVIHVGLPYVSELETLAVNFTGEETVFDKHKTIPSVSILLEESRGIFAGTRADQLDELKMRGTEDYEDPIALYSGTAKINIQSNWEGDGRVILRQEDPLPLAVLGIIPEVVTGGKK